MSQSWTLLGQLVTADGANVRSLYLSRPVKHRVWTIPACEVRSVQAPVISLRLEHGGPPTGRITHLERRSADGSIWCVGELDEDVDLPDRDIFLSVEAVYSTAGVAGSDIEIRGAALCERSCMIGLRPATITRSGLDQHGRRPALGTFQAGLLERADAARRSRKGGPILVETDPGAQVDYTSPAGIQHSRPTGRVEYRSAVTVDVSRALRELDLVISPAERPTVIHEPGRTFTEVFSVGAFAGVEENPSRVRVNRDHQRERVIGKAIALDAWAKEGLTGTIRLARVRDADEALALIDEGLLGVSAGFGVPAGGEEWRDRRRRIRSAALDHIALTPIPAYEGAEVLAVRGAQLTLAR